MKIKRVAFYTARIPLGMTVEEVLADLLRYDVMFVRTHDLTTTDIDTAREVIVAAPVFQNGLGRMSPTVARWQSWNCAIRETRSYEGYEGNFAANRDAWVTFRHPVGGQGRDYTRLLPVSLTNFTDPKRKDTIDL